MDETAAAIVGVLLVSAALPAAQAAQVGDGHADENVEYYLEQAGLEEVPEGQARIHTGDRVVTVSAEEAFERLGERTEDLDLEALAASASEHGQQSRADHVGDVFLSESAAENGERTLQCEGVFTGVPVGAGEHQVDPQLTVRNGSAGVGDSNIAANGGGLHVDLTTKTTHFHEQNTTWTGMTDFSCIEVDIPSLDLFLTIHISWITGAVEVGA